jgi:hypothetical protein
MQQCPITTIGLGMQQQVQVIYQHYSGNQRLTHKEEKKNEPNHGDG